VSQRKYFRTPATAPGPSGPAMARAVLRIRRNPMMFLTDTWQEFGDVVQFPIPVPPTYLVNDPHGVRQVLISNSRNYDKETIQYRSLSLVTGEGLLTAPMNVWRRQRPLVQPAFHHETLTDVVSHVGRAAHRMFESWERRGDEVLVDVDEAMMHVALEIVGHALFGTDLSQDADVLASATLEALEVVVARARVPVTPPQWVPTPANRRLRRSVARLDTAVDHMLAERSVRTKPRDMLDLLIAARDEQGDGLTTTEIRDQIITFIVAGHETVASALTWAWAMLARDPALQQRLADEADRVLDDRPPQFTDYANLPYARAVFDESLRMFPPAWLITRNSDAEDVIAGHTILPNSLIIISPWLVHRHPDAWPHAWEFRPERFLNETYDRTMFIPFGAGIRQCIGKDFAYVEGVLLLAAIAQRYEFRYPSGALPPAPEPLVTIRPVGGLPLIMRRRTSRLS
jgi:cytochrome P450